MAAFDQQALAALLDKQRYEDIAPQLDEDELKSATQDVLSGEWPAVIHLLGHLYKGKLTDARFLYKRIPQQRRDQDEEHIAALHLLQMMWNKDYQGVWQALAAPSWKPQSQPLLGALATRIREHNLQLLTRTYTTISVPKVAMMLGIPDSDVAEVVQRAGWTLDASTGMCQVNRPETPEQERAHAKQLDDLTQYLMHLESA